MAIRALTSGFAGPDGTFDSLGLQITPTGLTLVGPNTTNGLIGELRLAKEACEGLPKETWTSGVNANQFSSALRSAIADSRASSRVLMDLESSAINLVMHVGQEVVVRRRLPLEDPPFTTLPQAVPNFEKSPAVRVPDPTLLASVLSAFQPVVDVEAITIGLESGRMSFRAWPDEQAASYELRTKPSGAATTTLLVDFVQAVAAFGRSRPSEITAIEISVLQERLARFRYFFKTGTMTYWVAPMIDQPLAR